MAPSYALREGINGIVRERLARDGVVRGPPIGTEWLVSRGYTSAEKGLVRNYMAGGGGFHRPCKRLGIRKGDERRVQRVDRATGAVTLSRNDGANVDWEPSRLAAKAGGVEVYRREETELRAGDRNHKPWVERIDIVSGVIAVCPAARYRRAGRRRARPLFHGVRR